MVVTAPQAFYATSEFLIASISTIMHSRSLLPEHCFEDTEYIVNGHSYKRKTLRSGASDEADNMLSLIENKIFDRLKRGKIGFIKLFIADTVISPNSPTRKKHVLEVYSIEVSFPHQSHDGVYLRNRRAEENTVSIAAVNEEFYTTIRRHLDVTGSLDSLSTKYSYLVMAGGYDDNNDYDASSDDVSEFRSGRVFQMKMSENPSDIQRTGETNDDLQYELGTFNTFYVSSKIWMKRMITDVPQVKGFPFACECLGETGDSTECKYCTRRIHKCCYGAYDNSRTDITCY